MKIKRYTPFNHKRIGLYFGMAAILFLVGAFSYGSFDEWRYRPNTTFEAKRWNNPDLKYRYSVRAAVIQDVVKPGMSEQEIMTLLGTPNAITADEDWQYEVQQPGWGSGNWTGGGILVRFDRDRRVIDAVDNTLVD